MKAQHKTYNVDCIQGLRDNVDDDTIDLVFTDPPYGIDGGSLDVHYHRDESKVVEGYVDVPKDEYAEFSENWINECARVLRPGGSMYIVSGYTNLIDVLNALHKTSLIEVNHLIAEYTFAVSTKNKWVSSHYHILFWCKPPKTKMTFNSNWQYADQKDSYHDRLSVQQMPRSHKPGEIKNKNQLSEEFIKKFILYSSNRGDTVLDPFLGGFTTARTALAYGRNVIGFEMNKNAYAAFEPTLDKVEPLDDPVPMHPDSDELAKREKMREQWKEDRRRKKATWSDDIFPAK